MFKLSGETYDKLIVFGIPFLLIGTALGTICATINDKWNIFYKPSHAAEYIQVSELSMACGLVQSLVAVGLFCFGFNLSAWLVLLGPSCALFALYILYEMTFGIINSFKNQK